MTDKSHNKIHSADQAGGTQPSSYDRVVDTASSAYTASVDSARTTARQVGDGLEANPLAVLIGGLAVGAIAGALLPRSDKEKELLAPVGKRLSETARVAIAAARETATQELDNAGLTPGAARDKGKDLLGNVTKALSTAGTAAVQAAKQKQSGEASADAGDAPKAGDHAVEGSGGSDRQTQA